MKTKLILSSLVSLIIIFSCSNDPLQKKYNSDTLVKDLSQIEKVLNEKDFGLLTYLIDSLPVEKLKGNTYSQVLELNIKDGQVKKRIERRFIKKNSVKNYGNKLGKKNNEEEKEK